MAFLQKQAVRSRKKGNVYPFKRANGRSPARNPVQVGSPEDFASSVATQRQSLMASDWTKPGSGVSPVVFWSLFHRGKSDPGPGRGGPGVKLRSGWLWTLRGPGAVPPPLQNAPYRQGVDGGVEENRAPEGAGVIIGPGQHQARGQVLEHEKKIAEAVIDHSELPHMEEGKEKA